MCDAKEHVPSRRQFGLFGLSVLGLSALPFQARAADVEALALTCIDYRLTDAIAPFLAKQNLKHNYDQVALAGASLAGVSPKFPSSNAAAWDHVAIAKQLHHIKKLVVVDHRDCGAYKVAFGKDFAAPHDAETAQHKQVMLQFQAMLKQKHPDLGSEFYLMALDGSADRIV
jgi:carbonic anhydrase